MFWGDSTAATTPAPPKRRRLVWFHIFMRYPGRKRGRKRSFFTLNSHLRRVRYVFWDFFNRQHQVIRLLLRCLLCLSWHGLDPVHGIVRLPTRHAAKHAHKIFWNSTRVSVYRYFESSLFSILMSFLGAKSENASLSMLGSFV